MPAVNTGFFRRNCHGTQARTTYFVGMLDTPVQNSAVTLAAPVLLAFNAVNNLFGVGSSSMMSRALGRREYDMVRRIAAFAFWCTWGQRGR